jgi:hypothetical protein
VEDRSGAARHKDLWLQTAYASAQLQTRLLATYHVVRTSLEEELERSEARDWFHLKYMGEEMDENVSLVEPVAITESIAARFFQMSVARVRTDVVSGGDVVSTLLVDPVGARRPGLKDSTVISTRVAPFLRWSMATTCAVLRLER